MKLILELPDSIQVDENEMKHMLAAKLYETGRLSLGQAAEVAGMTKVEFAEILHRYDVSFINYPVSEMIKDVAAL
jgi:predicted HTH domain antitoxin